VRDGKTLLETKHRELYENKLKGRRGQINQKEALKTFNTHNQKRRKA
jgi:hypothetical protein